MKHSFISSSIDVTRCAYANCKRPSLDHGDKANCEACDYVGLCELLGEMLLCPNCLKKEYDTAIKHVKERTVNWETERINTAVTNPIGSILKSIEIDQALQIKDDFFNAETISIEELRTAFANSGIENQQYEFAKAVQARIELFKNVLFELNEAQINLNSRFKAQFQSLNAIAKELTDKERAELKLQDINYKPLEKEVKVSKPRLTAQEKMAQNLVASKLAKAAKELIENGTCKDEEESLKVAKARGLGITIEQARTLVNKALGVNQ